MSTCLLVIDDGREDYLDRCLESAATYLPPMDACVMVNDADHELGFAGAVQAGWDAVLEAGCEWVFHLESDFVLRRPVPVEAMIATLVARPYLAQMALLRQPWSQEELAAGGVIQMNKEDYVGTGGETGQWLEHRRHITTNPSLWPRWVLDRGWPQRPDSEGHFGIDLFRGQPNARAAYWGSGEIWVTHVGLERAGKGY